MTMLGRVLLALLATALTITGYAYLQATAAPVVRRAQIVLPSWPRDARPVTTLLISDIHVAGPDMPPARLARIVAGINALQPDLVLIAGDLISEKRVATRIFSMAEAIAPLGRLRPRLGTIAVLGNHDHWFDPEGAKSALARAGVTLLGNQAVNAGPLVIGGLDDAFTGRDDLPLTLTRMRELRGAGVVLSHSPDPFPELPRGFGLMLAGHTHCGQIAPWPIGAIMTMSKFGRRYACGIVREDGNALVVSAGLGTSGLPLRLGPPPDMWLLTLTGD